MKLLRLACLRTLKGFLWIPTLVLLLDGIGRWVIIQYRMHVLGRPAVIFEFPNKVQDIDLYAWGPGLERLWLHICYGAVLSAALVAWSGYCVWKSTKHEIR
jgi:hypothetical protein